MNTHKVLIVDDEVMTCKLISTMLKLQGYDSISITDPTLIWDTLAAENPTLILMDLHLGTLNGLEILQELRKREVGQDIPVLMTSGIDCRKEAMAAGADGFLIKPFNWQELATIINKMVVS